MKFQQFDVLESFECSIDAASTVEIECVRAICEMRNNNQGMAEAFVSQVGYNKNNNLREINDVGRVVGERVRDELNTRIFLWMDIKRYKL